MSTTHQFPLFVIYSKKVLTDLREFLYDYGNGADGIGEMHIDRTHDGKETDRTICLLDESIYDGLVENGYAKQPPSDRRTRRPPVDVAITRYRLTPGHHPKPGHTYNFFIQLPRSAENEAFADMKASDYEKQLQEKVDALSSFGVLPENGVKIKVPYTSRTTGEAQGVAYITFADFIDRDAIAAARVFIDNSLLWNREGKKFSVMKCFYAREMRSDEPKAPRAPKEQKAFQPRQMVRRGEGRKNHEFRPPTWKQKGNSQEGRSTQTTPEKPVEMPTETTGVAAPPSPTTPQTQA